MLLQWIWLTLMGLGAFYACLTGKGSIVLPSLLQGCSNAVELSLRMCAGYLFFSGLMEIAKDAGASRVLERALKPALRKLMPHMGRASEAVVMNLSMNVLGLGNAATPKGMEAVRLLEAERSSCPMVRHDLYLFLILNATSIQLLPTTVITLRAAAGSADPEAVVLPTLLCTAVTTAVGVGAGCLLRRNAHVG